MGTLVNARSDLENYSIEEQFNKENIDQIMNVAKTYMDTETSSQQEVLKHNTTSFIEDAHVRAATMDRFVDVPKEYGVDSVDTGPLAAFFAKPHIILQGEINASTGNIFYGALGPYILSNTRWAQKMAGYALCRGTAVIRMTINAEPFHQGRVLLSVLPMGNRFSGTYQAMRRASLTAQTQLPNVELDFRDTSAELRIPYVTPVQWYAPYETTNFDWGNLSVDMLSSFATGSGTPNCSYTIWLSFEDMEFSMPVAPQSGVRSSRKSKRVKRIGGVEASKMQQGTISSALDTVSSVAETFESVPLLSSFAAPVSWAARLAGSIASAFGYSKPNNDSVSSFYAHRAYRGYANAEGMSNAEPLSLVARPEVQVLPGFAGTDLDEMSFNYLKTIPAYVGSFDWAATDTTDSILYQIAVAPTSFSTTVPFITGGGTYLAEYAPPAFHLREYFRYYRGSVRMHLKIIKTEFHSGRLQVCYTPDALGGTNTPPSNAADSQFSLREIIDIRERSEVILELPYLSNSNYIDVSEKMGTVQIRVLNELRAPATASQSVEVLVYFSGGDDYELVAPRPTTSRVITPQSGLDSGTIQTAKPIGNLLHKDHHTDFAATSIGDSFTTVKQLIMKYSRFANGFSLGGGNGIATWFFANNNVVPATGPAHDMLSAMSSGYLLARGSMRYVIVACPTGSQPMNSSYTMLSPNTLSTVLGLQPGFSTSQPGATDLIGGLEASFQDVRGGTEVLVPYYNKTLASIVTYSTSAALATNESVPNSRLSYGQSPDCANFVARAAGDDFQFGYFVGFAPFSRAFTPA